MKISLNQQIDALRRELHDLERERPQRERKRGYNFQEYNYHMECLKSALKTLLWVQTHETALRRAVEEPEI